MMRTMDGLMAIPSILLAIAVVSLSGASVMTVLIAITIPRNSARGTAGAFGGALRARGALCGSGNFRRLQPAEDHVATFDAEHDRPVDRARHLRLRLRHPHRGHPVVPRHRHQPGDPTWGNIMAEGRAFFQIKPSLIFWPGLVLSIRDSEHQPNRRRRPRRARSPPEAAGGPASEFTVPSL